MSRHHRKPKGNRGKQKQSQSALFEANPYENNETQEEKPGEAENTSNKEIMHPMIQAIYNFVFRNRASAWTAIFTCVLAIFSYLLWKANSDANETSIETQRAFLSYSGIQIAKNAEVDNDKLLKGIRVFVAWVNSGTTPTRTAITEANLFIGPDSPQGANFDGLSQSAPALVVIGPKSAAQSNPVDISMSDLEELTGGTRHVFVWGWAAYYDIFPNTPMRLSEYCTELLHPVWSKKDHADASGDIHLDTPPCPVHNCYDENCSDYHQRVTQLAGVLHHQ